MDSKYREYCYDRLTDILQDLICDEGPEGTANVIRDSIDSWLEYHESEAAKWKELKAILHL